MTNTIDRQPKMFPKFIQLVSHRERLWALDDNGDCWWKDVEGGNVWKRSTARREDDKS